MKVMLVDDEAEIGHVIDYLLKRKGHDVVAFSDPHKALKAISALKPDVIICDFRMPNMSGMEFLRNAKQQWECPFIMLTGASGTNVEAAKAAGFKEVLFKPRDIEQIIDILDSLS